VIDAARVATPVVVDTGAWPQGADIVKAAAMAVVVVDASPNGVVRAATMLTEWAGPPPRLILNRVTSQPAEAVAAARRWTGLEPVAVITFHNSVMRGSRRGQRPDVHLLKALRRVVW
jgi:hypothetical protein